MVWVGPPNCKNLDNDRNCRVMHDANFFNKFFDIRPSCILNRQIPPRDGEWTCDEQVPYVRIPPSSPAPMPRKK